MVVWQHSLLFGAGSPEAVGLHGMPVLLDLLHAPPLALTMCSVCHRWGLCVPQRDTFVPERSIPRFWMRHGGQWLLTSWTWNACVNKLRSCTIRSAYDFPARSLDAQFRTFLRDHT